MKEHPKLFKGDMVNAILDGSKTQTRLPATFHNSVCVPRITREQFTRLQFDKAINHGLCLEVPILGSNFAPTKNPEIIVSVYPRYEVGDHLWVRETWGIGTRPCPQMGWVDGIEYRADEAYVEDERDSLHLYDVETPDDICLDDYAGKGWIPSVHMFRWASRINLEVTRRWPEKVRAIK